MNIVYKPLRIWPLATGRLLRRTIVNLAHNVYDKKTPDTGAAPICIMHGLFGSKKNWHTIATNLNDRTKPTRKVITVDARNHGDTEHTDTHSYAELATDVQDFLGAQKVDRSIVIGHSMGGRAMMCLALDNPEMVEKAIIVDISPVQTSPLLLAMEGIFGAMKSVRVAADLDMTAARKAANEQLMATSTMDEGTRSFVLTNFVRKPTGGYGWRQNVDVLHREFRENISRFPPGMLQKRFDGPVLFLGGRHADFIHPNQMPEIQKIFPNSRLEMLNTGHLVHAEAPDEVMKLILDFINT